MLTQCCQHCSWFSPLPLPRHVKQWHAPHRNVRQSGQLWLHSTHVWISCVSSHPHSTIQHILLLCCYKVCSLMTTFSSPVPLLIHTMRTQLLSLCLSLLYPASQCQEDPLAGLAANIPGLPGQDYPIFANPPETSFECDGKIQGYYSDRESDCEYSSYVVRQVKGLKVIYRSLLYQGRSLLNASV